MHWYIYTRNLVTVKAPRKRVQRTVTIDGHAVFKDNLVG
jgi:hypothetical protein